MIEITDCLGRIRSPDKIYVDGSWNCPFCCAGVQVGTHEHSAQKCPNPACFAHPTFPIERARELIALEEARKAEIKQQEDLAEWRREYAEEQNRKKAARLDLIRATAQVKGACVSCAIESARYRAPKYVRHRKGCPQAKR